MRRSKFTSHGLMRAPSGHVTQKLQWRNKHDGTPQEFTNSRPFAGADIPVGKTSQIHYESGNGGSYRPCYHSVIDYGSPSLMQGPPQFGSWTVFGQTTTSVCSGLMGYVHTIYPDLGAFAGSSDPRKLSDLPWDELSARAYQAMRPTMLADNSLLNFLYELKDFKHLAKAIWDRLNRRATTDEVVKQLFGGVRRTRPKDTLRNLSKSYLQYKFAFAPFVSDIVNMWHTLDKLNNKFIQLKTRCNTPQSRRWSTLVSGTEIPAATLLSDMVGMPGGSVGNYSPRCKVRVIREAESGTMYHANMRYTYELPPEVNGIHGQIKAYMDALGVRLNPQIVWNAIPFTFLIDWFFNVGEVLGRFSVDNLQIKVRISEFCHSAKQVVNITAYAQLNWDSNGTERWYGEFPFRNMRRSVYTRSTGFPSLVGSLDLQDPNVINSLSAGALIISNRR